MKREGVSEKLLSHIWKGQQFARDGLITGNGQRLQVVYPGRLNSDSGPDFCDAVIATEAGELAKGDIELHVRSSHWRAHGHHHDPRFNKVILQVVMWDDTSEPTQLQNGKTAPVLALQNYLQGLPADLCSGAKLPMRFPEPCNTALERWDHVRVAEVLEDMGGERFEAKAALFEAELATEEPQQVLYEGIMVALGYSKNKRPFKELARRLPLHVMAGFVQGKPRQRQVLLAQALLFGMAGLLPSQRQREAVDQETSGITEEMEQIWRSFGVKDSLSESDWRFFRVRPDNLPSRRLAGAGHLAVRYIEKGLAGGLLHLVATGQPEKSDRELEWGLIVHASGYWANHADLVGSARAKSSTLVGRGRARDIVVNVVLPFSFAWGQTTSNPRLAKEALQIYRRYTKLDDNEVTREMSSKLFGRKSAPIITSAQRQQGLIHLYKTFCVERRCTECPLT